MAWSHKVKSRNLYCVSSDSDAFVFCGNSTNSDYVEAEMYTELTDPIIRSLCWTIRIVIIHFFHSILKKIAQPDRGCVCDANICVSESCVTFSYNFHIYCSRIASSCEPRTRSSLLLVVFDFLLFLREQRSMCKS